MTNLTKALETHKWNDFKINQIFLPSHNGKSIRKKDRKPGKTPYIGAPDNNNGVVQFINSNNTKEFKNVIGVNGNGNGVGIAFYHLHTVCISNDVRILKSTHLNVYTALFLNTCIRQQRKQFSFGFKLTCSRLDNLYIKLPVDKNNNPDWTFMEKYIKNLSRKLKQSLIQYHLIHSNISLKNRSWHPFMIKNLIDNDIKQSKDYPKKDREPGKIPYIGRTRFNNGITDYISKSSNTPNTIYKNVIAVNRNGSTGYAFYHPYRAYFSGGVRVLPFKHLNWKIALFITTCIKEQRHQFNYGFELGKVRLKNLKINLPVTNKSLKSFKQFKDPKSLKPDYDFMESYIKSLIKY